MPSLETLVARGDAHRAWAYSVSRASDGTLVSVCWRGGHSAVPGGVDHPEYGRCRSWHLSPEVEVTIVHCHAGECISRESASELLAEVDSRTERGIYLVR